MAFTIFSQVSETVTISNLVTLCVLKKYLAHLYEQKKEAALL